MTDTPTAINKPAPEPTLPRVAKPELALFVLLAPPALALPDLLPETLALFPVALDVLAVTVADPEGDEAVLVAWTPETVAAAL